MNCTGFRLGKYVTVLVNMFLLQLGKLVYYVRGPNRHELVVGNSEKRKLRTSKEATRYGSISRDVWQHFAAAGSCITH